MKKTFAMLLVFALLVISVGCAARQIPVSDISTAFLRSCNVSSSSITAADFDYFSSFTPEKKTFNYWYVSSLVEGVMMDHYRYETVEKEAVSSKDVVKAEVTINGYTDDNYSGEKKEIMIVVGSGEFNEAVEQRLLGSAVGAKYEVELSSDGIGAYPQTSGKTVTVSVLSIGKFVIGSDGKKMLQENGFSSWEDFYDYLFDIKYNEADFEQYSQKVKDFFDKAFEKCKFDISEDDLKNYSVRVAGDYVETAGSFNMGKDEFYSNFLGMAEDEFFMACVDSAEYEIKKCLVTGAVAAHLSIEIDSAEFEEFCSHRRIQTTDEDALAAAKYLLLETKVLKQIGVTA